MLTTKFVVHYKSAFGDIDSRGPIDGQKAYEELENFGEESLPIHALKEGEYVVYIVNDEKVEQVI